MKSMNMVKRVIWELEAILHFVNSKRLSHITWICNLFPTNPKIVKLFVFVILAMAGNTRTQAQSLCIHTMMHHFSALSFRVRFIFCSLRFGWMFLNHMQHIINVHTGKCGFSFWGKSLVGFFLFSVRHCFGNYTVFVCQPVFQHTTLVYFPFVSFDESIIAEVAHTLQNASTSKQTYTLTYT